MAPSTRSSIVMFSVFATVLLFTLSGSFRSSSGLRYQEIHPLGPKEQQSESKPEPEEFKRDRSLSRKMLTALDESTTEPKPVQNQTSVETPSSTSPSSNVATTQAVAAPEVKERRAGTQKEGGNSKKSSSSSTPGQDIEDVFHIDYTAPLLHPPHSHMQQP